MSRTLRVLCCDNYRPELEGAAAAEAWDDVTVSAFEARCGRPPVRWSELAPLVDGEDADLLLVGGACLAAVEIPAERRDRVRQHRCTQCFELVAGSMQIGEALARNAYLVTPGWLDHWREHLDGLGFSGASAAALFREFARELVLLDTGVSPRSTERLAELARTLALPCTRLPVGLDHARLLLTRLVLEWRLAVERRSAVVRESGLTRERADLLATLDFLRRLGHLDREEATLAALDELFRMLFAPRLLHVVRVEADTVDAAVPAPVRSQIAGLQGDWTWTASGTGFLVRISHGAETVGVVVLDGLAFPAYRTRYLELALSVARVSGLAIWNARNRSRLERTEECLRRNEQSLRLAQAIAHVGHWEYDAQGDAFSWSEETSRILGYAPAGVPPSRDAFLRAVHPDDRDAVERAFSRSQQAGHLDLEYRVVPPTGGVRFVRAVGEVVFLGPDRQPRLVGTVTDLAGGAPSELLGVVQDITDRKALERRLEEEARTDALTGCANRRAFLQKAEQEFARVRRYGGVLSVAMLDLDHFKRINDARGHPVGDEALRELARLCFSSLRSHDLVARIGGEEFAVLLPQTAPDEAAEVAERLRLAVAQTEIRLSEGPPVRLTTSVGVTGLSPEDASVAALLERADRALYQAKAAGRDRVVTLAPAPARPPPGQPQPPTSA